MSTGIPGHGSWCISSIASSVDTCGTSGTASVLHLGKEILRMHATTEVDWHVKFWSERIIGPQIYPL